MVEQSAQVNVSLKAQENVDIVLQEEIQFSTLRSGVYSVPAIRDANGALYIRSCVDYLKQIKAINKSCGYLYEDRSNAYTWIGLDPLPQNFTIPLDASFPTLVLKMRPQQIVQKTKKIKSLVGMQIGQVIQLIKEQARLSQSFSNQKAAKQVGMEKNLIDEAKSQIIQAKRNGFNIQGHLKDKIEVLKRFNILNAKADILNKKQMDVIDKMGKLFILIEKGNKLCKKEDCCSKIETKFTNNPMISFSEDFSKMSIELEW